MKEGIVTETIKTCLKRGMRAKVAQRFLQVKHNIKVGNEAFQTRLRRLTKNN